MRGRQWAAWRSSCWRRASSRGSGQPILLLYAAAFAVAVAAFVHWYEEPTLRRQFGEQYETYRRAVPAWWPRRQPWDARDVDRS